MALVLGGVMIFPQKGARMLKLNRSYLPGLLVAAAASVWLLAGCSDTSVLPLQSTGDDSRAQVGKPASPVPQEDAAVTILTRNQPSGPFASGGRSAPSTPDDASSTVDVLSLAHLSATARVTPQAGGVLRAGNNGLGFTTLTIPPGAVARPRLITMTVGASGPVDVTFGPSGLKFDRPVRLEMSYRGAELNGVNPNSLKIYYDSRRNGWEAVPACSADGVSETVTAKITHFSRYAIGSDG